MKSKQCQICLGPLYRHSGTSSVRNCRYRLASPGPDCWFELGGLHATLAESLAQRRPRDPVRAEKRESLFRNLHETVTVNEAVARQHLGTLTDNDRYLLLKYAAPGLRDWLLSSYKYHDLNAQPNLIVPRYPDLPEGLLGTLKQWEAKNRRRLEARIEKGRSRSPDALRRLMNEPIKLAQFLADHGIDRWDKMTFSDQIAYAKTRPKSAQRKIAPFIRFVEGQDNFPERRGRPSRKKATSVIRESESIPVLSPDVLESRLEQARKRLSDNEYLLYWLVARFGLTAKKAYGLTLDRVTINNKGRVVIKPAQAWVALPKSLASTMESVCRSASDEWPYNDPTQALEVPIFASMFSKYRRRADPVFQGETSLLRSSAIFAAMHEGVLDHKTLSAITGVSLTTISKLEYMLPADIHSLASHDFVAKRNCAILGDEDE